MTIQKCISVKKTVEASAIIIACALVVFVAFYPSEVFETPSYQEDQCGCKRIDESKPTIYLTSENDKKGDDLVRVVLQNNINCSITITTLGRQIFTENTGKVRSNGESVLRKDAIVTVKYKINSAKKPWEFIIYWPYGHSAEFTSEVLAGNAISFSVPKKFLGKKRQIAVPFNYVWEGVRFGATSGIEHLIYSYR
ncbi:MAG: hypothetical protein JST84_17455 [Acidobacteria bacterium]|nr:hypothetical protein [Acidobacteriota bacterium]